MSDVPAGSKDRQRGGMTGGIILTGVGVLFLLQNFDVLEFGHSWPLIVIVVGLALILRPPKRENSTHQSTTPGT